MNNLCLAALCALPFLIAIYAATRSIDWYAALRRLGVE